MAVRHLKTEEFQSKVQEAEKLVVVDFFATWCGPCKMLAPVLEQAAQAHPDVEFYKVDIDEESALAEQFRIMTVPTLLFVKNGRIVQKSTGVITKKDMESYINEAK